jgi:carbon-monoxide dehydrogenase medium subunit
VKAPDVAYVKPGSLPEVFDWLDRYDDARLLAGGQSLIAGLNMRLSQPQVLIDINGIEGLSSITETNGTIRIGALTRHAELGESRLIAEKLPLIAQAVPHIAHMAIRNRGTIGGSLALADPATELPACCLALGASIIATGEGGERRIPIGEYFKGLFETALQRNEVLTAIEIPIPGEGAKAGFSELVRRHGDYAIVGLAAQGAHKNGKWSSLRLAYIGVGDHAILARQAAETLISGGNIEDAQQSLARDLSPSGDLENSAETKMHFSRVLLQRVLSTMSA